MTGRLLDWYALSREAVPGVLLGMEATTSLVQSSSLAPSNHSADLLVGFEKISPSHKLAAPCVALIADERVGELFAWLHTYSTESFPISQFCRIETVTRWDSLLDAEETSTDFRSAAWASVVAGEMLANAEQNLELKAVPLSWTANCFSYTMARVFRAWSKQDGNRSSDVASRLRMMENDPRFARRKVNVDMLSPLWAILSSGESIESDNVSDVVGLVLSALDAEGALLLRSNSKLLSNSAEQRIHGFDEFVDQILNRQPSKNSLRTNRIGALLASAALMAGGGTSHVELLKPYADAYPDCLPWFGLIAGLAGPHVWDSDWLRLVKGVERQVRNGFQLSDPLQGDLCWIEFDWLSRLSKSVSVFIEIPKHHNRLLTVEVFPGATYQLRLVAPVQEARVLPKAEPKVNLVASRSDELQRTASSSGEAEKLLSQLKDISGSLQEVVMRLTSAGIRSFEGGQPTLFDPVPVKTPARRTSNRVKKSSGG